jgi:hypothetical protein
MNDWNIQSRAHDCQTCGKAFADQQPYHTLLFDRRHAFERLDICLDCWQAQHGEGASDRKGFVSHWQGIYEAPPPPAPDPIKKENAESLLRKLMEQNDTRYAAATYILAVMLERKRLLKVKEQFHREGQRVFVYEHPKSGDLFTIPDPELQLNRLEEVQRDVAALLEHGVPEAGAALPPAGGLATDASIEMHDSPPLDGKVAPAGAEVSEGGSSSCADGEAPVKG